MNRNALILAAFCLVALSGCGPGIPTDAAPLLVVDTPTDGMIVTSLTQSFAGSCREGLPIALGYGSNVSGPALADCTGGRFSFSVQVQAIGGDRSVSLAQVTDRGTLGITVRKFHFTRVAWPLGTGGATGPYVGPDIDPVLASNQVADTVKGGSVNVLRTDSSGALLVGGAFNRYDGSAVIGFARKTSIAVSGASGVDGIVNALAPAPDSSGDYYIGGQFTNQLSRNSGTTGSAIGSFASLGFTGSVDGTQATAVNAVVGVGDATTDIYVAGNFDSYGPTPFDGIVRLTSTGALSSATTFNSNVETGGVGFSGGGVYALAMALDGSHDVLVGGGFTHYQTATRQYFIRLGPDGMRSVATSDFNGPVYAILPLPGTAHEILVAGAFTAYGATPAHGIFCLQANGTACTSAWNNLIATGFDQPVYSLALGDSSGNTVVAGGAFTTFNGTSRIGVARLLASTGGLDSSFTVAAGFAGGNVHTVTVDSTGTTWVGGAFAAFDGIGVHGVVALESDGTISPATHMGAGFNDRVVAVAATADNTGDLYVGGGFTYYNGVPLNQLARVRMDGSVNTAFSSGTGFDGDVFAIAPAPDSSGDIYVGGNFTTYQGVAVPMIVRLSSTGARRTSFNAATITTPVRAIVPVGSSSTDIFVAGGNATTTDDGFISRLQSTGADNTVFDDGSGFNAAVRTLAVAPDGTLIAGGKFTVFNGVQTANHLIFFNTLSVATAPASFDDDVYSIALDSSGHIFAGGKFTHVNATAVNRLVALNSVGTIYSAYNVGTGVNGTVLSVALATDGSGDVLVGGAFTTYQGAANGTFYLRTTGTGTAVTSASSTSFPDAAVYAVLPAADGSSDVYLGGIFRLIHTSLSDSLTRVSSAGSPD